MYFVIDLDCFWLQLGVLLFWSSLCLGLYVGFCLNVGVVWCILLVDLLPVTCYQTGNASSVVFRFLLCLLAEWLMDRDIWILFSISLYRFLLDLMWSLISFCCLRWFRRHFYSFPSTLLLFWKTVILLASIFLQYKGAKILWFWHLIFNLCHCVTTSLYFRVLFCISIDGLVQDLDLFRKLYSLLPVIE